jgi:ABC-type dipeptide/oligopeptide/nickel transport system ATPase component
MKDGRIVEQGPIGQIFDALQTSYVRDLIDAIPGRREATDQLARHGPRHHVVNMSARP